MAELFWRLRRVVLVCTDAFLVILAFYLAWYVRYELEWYRAVDPASYTEFSFYLTISAVAALLVLLGFYLEGVYTLPRGTGYLDEFYRLFTGTTVATLLLMLGNYMFQPPFHSRLVYGIAGVLILLFVTISRLIYRQATAMLRRRGVGIKWVLLVGAGEISRRLMRVLLANSGLGYRIVGFLDDNPERGQRNLGPYAALGPIDNLAQVLAEQQVDEVIITLPWQYHRRIMSILSQCERARVLVRVVPDILQISLDRVDLEVLDGIPLLGVKQVSISGPRRAIKRIIDLILSSLVLIATAPLLLVLAIAIRLDTPGPILFKQERIGKDGKPFQTYKFRSMVADAEQLREQLHALNEADGPLFKIRNDPRMTRVGRYMRRLSLDELPQFWNVLRGEMSVVGPRPALPDEAAAYEPWHRKRLEVLPGITGMWQVSGRSDIGFDEMMLLDIYYVENWSPLLDLSIILRTVPSVLLGEGAY